MTAARLKIVVSPVRVRVSPLGNSHNCGIYCFSERAREAIIGYSSGYLGPVYSELETESPGLISIRRLLETK